MCETGGSQICAQEDRLLYHPNSRGTGIEKRITHSRAAELG
jgi:hypothetical protein